jgi:hypothetical protein
MAVYCVCYTVGDGGVHSLEGPKDRVRTLGGVCELTPSTWLVDTTLHGRAILDHLQADLGDCDQFVVFEVAKKGDWAISQGAKVTAETAAVWMERHVGVS